MRRRFKRDARAKLPSHGFALFHEVNHAQAALYQTGRRHKLQDRLDNVTPIGGAPVGDGYQVDNIPCRTSKLAI
jgi:hypothetical protein